MNDLRMDIRQTRSRTFLRNGAEGRLGALGHELRRPEADGLRDGTSALRVALQRTNDGRLYSFHRRETSVLSLGLGRERELGSVAGSVAGL